jgi:hypothetical protein
MSTEKSPVGWEASRIVGHVAKKDFENRVTSILRKIY